jgi:rhamnogalacturonyl hydrolase YesR
VLKAMEKVATWQLDHPAKASPTDWTSGAFYAGLVATGNLSPDPRFRQAMLDIGRLNTWKPGPRVYDADDQTVIQSYLDMYRLYRDPAMLAPAQQRFDTVLDAPPPLNRRTGKPNARDHWSWCDALFMDPPAWARLYALTGNARYLDFLVREWRKTYSDLYDPQERLFFRDASFIPQRGPNDKKVFWSRGDGWVLAGLVRVLQCLPDSDLNRDFFVQQFKDIAERIRSLQPADGIWHASLLDPDAYPTPEARGTGFYCYAMAWGIDEGILNRATFEPAVRKAWAGLVGLVDADGRLSHVQPGGASPVQFNPQNTQNFGVGAFLLAGSEVERLTLLATKPHVQVTASSQLTAMRSQQTIEANWDALKHAIPNLNPADVAVMQGSAWIPCQVLPGPNGKPATLLFQGDFLPDQNLRFTVFARISPTALPSPTLQASAMFVPQREDDFEWENDRIAYRVYGPALQATGEISSGVDVWVKSVRKLIGKEWYAGGNYHVDHGEGMDRYDVKTSRGCGGLAVWAKGKMWPSQNFKTWKILADGPVRVVFQLTYAPWEADGRKVSETRIISLDTGSNLSRFESHFAANGRGPLDIAIGIVQRPGKGMFHKDPVAGWMTYWEPGAPPNGSIGCAAAVPWRPTQFLQAEGHYLAEAQVTPGQPLVYYAGAAWSKGLDFHDDAAWTSYVESFVRGLQSPLVVQIGPQ